MFKRLKPVILIIVLLLLYSPAVFADTEEIHIQVESNYPPFKFIQNGYLSGFDIELSNLVFNQDYSVIYSYDIWDKVYERIKNGSIDSCGLLSVTDERKKDILYSNPVLHSHFALYSRKTGDKITPENLKDYKIGVVKGYYTEALLKDKLHISAYSTFTNFDECIDGLVQEKVEVIFGNQEVINYLLIKKQLSGEIVPQTNDLYPVDFAYGISKSSPHLVEFMNKRILELKKSGVYEELYQKYFFTHSDYYREIQQNRVIKIIALSAVSLVLIFLFLQIYIRFLKQKILKVNKELHRIAYYDSLTGLPNRSFFMDKLEAALKTAREEGTKAAMLFLDLDNFKTVNDTLGHTYGDMLLKEIGKALEEQFKDVDVIARFGGDEFIILKERISKADDAERIAKRVIQAFQRTWRIQEREFYITPSIGMTFYPYDGPDEQTLLKNADTAMYHAKELGKNNYQIYAHTMNAAIMERIETENSLRHAVDRNELVIHYQPQVDIITGRITGAEALLRWMHPGMELVPPARFIRLAEESGLIVPIGEWILRKACEQWVVWNNSGFGFVSIAVNLSARQFRQGSLLEKIQVILAETGMEPKRLCLEITESIAMHDLDYTVGLLKRLKEMGIRVYLDDFGKGYSSLNYLRHLPIDALKIDKSFVDEITTDSSEEAIAKAVISMAHSMKLEVIAEGVETEAQMAFLKEQRCDKVQGYLFSKPVAMEEFESMLRENKTFTAK